MSRASLLKAAVAAAIVTAASAALGAMPMAPVNNLPNPYEANDNWFKLPDGRKWGSTAGVAIAPIVRNAFVGGEDGLTSQLHADVVVRPVGMSARGGSPVADSASLARSRRASGRSIQASSSQ